MHSEDRDEASTGSTVDAGYFISAQCSGDEAVVGVQDHSV
jgi:hypothetical protein